MLSFCYCNQVKIATKRNFSSQFQAKDERKFSGRTEERSSSINHNKTKFWINITILD
jgi:hypothetical protein